jgi:SAM-dependent methyltransferase
MTDQSWFAARALSFGSAARAYEHGRPEYPDDAIDWLIPEAARDVIDLGAGTGKLTRALVARGLEVTAVDPSSEMLAVLSTVLPTTPTLVGTGEAIPVADAIVDLVVAAQSWHWVDPIRASVEVARVLRPGGRLGMVWNSRDETSEWMQRLGAVIGDDPVHSDTGGLGIVGPPFDVVEQFTTTWTAVVTRAEAIDMVASRSIFITATPESQAATIDELKGLLDEQGDEIRIPYVTRAFRTQIS